MKFKIALLIAQALFLFCYQIFSYANEIAITFDDLPASIEDPPLAKTGNLFERRKPLWERGSTNISYVIKELNRINPSLNLSRVTLIGHSNGGDIAMLFASSHPQLVKKIISLDSLRMPFPRTGLTPILSLRGNDTKADEDVLPPTESLKQLAIIIPLPQAKHIDLCDRGSDVTQQQINDLILKFLRG